MFGSGTKVELTKELKKAAKEWKKKSEAFLDAKSTFVCSEMEFEGKRIKPQDLPDAEKIRVVAITPNVRGFAMVGLRSTNVQLITKVK
jgi:hypothetical protein